MIQNAGAAIAVCDTQSDGTRDQTNTDLEEGRTIVQVLLLHLSQPEGMLMFADSQQKEMKSDNYNTPSTKGHQMDL